VSGSAGFRRYRRRADAGPRSGGKSTGPLQPASRRRRRVARASAGRCGAGQPWRRRLPRRPVRRRPDRPRRAPPGAGPCWCCCGSRVRRRSPGPPPTGLRLPGLIRDWIERLATDACFDDGALAKPTVAGSLRTATGPSKAASEFAHDSWHAGSQGRGEVRLQRPTTGRLAGSLRSGLGVMGSSARSPSCAGRVGPEVLEIIGVDLRGGFGAQHEDVSRLAVRLPGRGCASDRRPSRTSRR